MIPLLDVVGVHGFREVTEIRDWRWCGRTGLDQRVVGVVAADLLHGLALVPLPGVTQDRERPLPYSPIGEDLLSCKVHNQLPSQ